MLGGGSDALPAPELDPWVVAFAFAPSTDRSAFSAPGFGAGASPCEDGLKTLSKFAKRTRQSGSEMRTAELLNSTTRLLIYKLYIEENQYKESISEQ